MIKKGPKPDYTFQIHNCPKKTQKMIQKVTQIWFKKWTQKRSLLPPSFSMVLTPPFWSILPPLFDNEKFIQKSDQNTPPFFTQKMTQKSTKKWPKIDQKLTIFTPWMGVFHCSRALRPKKWLFFTALAPGF